MGARGPVPKRSDQRRRRNKDNAPEQTPASTKDVTAPAEDRDWHITAKRWYRGLKKSSQARYYEPSDWAYAQMCADLISREFHRESPRAAMISRILTMMDNLLTSEGARRRLRVEFVRDDDDTAPGDNVVQLNPEALYG
ncbi:hypothetical protein [Corynebacterium antarcticum]|uniref:phage terminase small subunit n=1 Tax=Corynebacterium antarcticum TaxID=2800405 RepID=UPI002002EEBE|nr:hypothetical protein [Corynebacterium antarcticum]MCK7661980.1 hypothetical protein [Corynebacterium antarcticum]